MPEALNMQLSSARRSGGEREFLRQKGQFWTPRWVADFMVAYVLRDKPARILDPAVGQGAFFLAAKEYAVNRKFPLKLYGRDIDPAVIELACKNGLSREDLVGVEIKDFVLVPPVETFSAIVANPPYIRHHRLSVETKRSLQAYARHVTGEHIDGRAGLQVFFLIRALQTLAPEGRLAYLVSADICEGIFAESLWRWICSKYRLDVVATFSSEASLFPGVDTNAIVLFIANQKPRAHFRWLRCKVRDTRKVLSCVNGNNPKAGNAVEIHNRSLVEGLATGFSRQPTDQECRYRLSDFARVMRGIVTGDNGFFFLTSAQVREVCIPPEFFRRAIGRTRDVGKEILTKADLEKLDVQGRPTWLLSINGQPCDQLPPAIQQYLRAGEKKGLPDKKLLKTRNPWYRMESREIPPILFAYLGRRNSRFIRNSAEAVPLTSFLCVYPRMSDPAFLEALWRVLLSPDIITNLRLVGKSYGGDAIKVEPRALERLPLPMDLIKRHGLDKRLLPKQGYFPF